MKKPKKINLLFTVGAYPPADKEGGPGIMIKALSEYLVKNNCSIKVATTNKNGNERLHYENETIKQENVEVFYGKCNKSFFPYHSMPMLKYIYKVIDDIDFVFISSSWNLYGVITGIIARFFRKPYALYSHGSYHPIRIRKNRFIKALWWYLFDRKLYNQANFVIAMSKNEKLQVKSYGIKSKIIVLPIGIDKELMNLNSDPEIALNYPKKEYILFLSRISEIKNLKYTFDYYGDFLIENNLMLLVAGGGDPKYVDDIKNYIINHKARKHIKLLGAVSDEEKKLLLQRAKFFTLLSKAEGLPQSILEAMHFGVPIIASPECNLLDAMNQKVVLNSSDDRTLLVLRELNKDKDKYQAISIKTKLYARQNFNWKTISNEYLENINKYI